MIHHLMIFGIYAGVAVLFLAGVILRIVFSRVGIEIILWRLLSGHHLHGTARTDATWFHRGTKVINSPSGRASEWEHKPRALRALIRLTVLFVFLGFLFGLTISIPVTINAMYGLIAAFLFYHSSKLADRLMSSLNRHNKQVLNPLAASLGKEFGWSKVQVKRALDVTPESLARETGEVGTINLPDDFQGTEAQKHKLSTIVDEHLPVDTEIEWRITAFPKHAKIVASGRPPAVVNIEDVLEDIYNAESGRVILGKDRFKKVFSYSFNDGEDPHWGFNVNTGRGKSTTLGLIAAQILRQDPDARATIIDPKIVSMPGMETVPGVSMYNDPAHVEKMWEGIDKFAEEMENRMRVKEEARLEGRTVEFPPALLLIDEVNRFASITASVWQQQRAQNQPRSAPVWQKIAAVLWMGREVHCHCVIVGQRLDDKSVGGIGLRDSLGLRGLSGFWENQWKMLVGTSPAPISQPGTGRWIYSDGENHTWVQNVKAKWPQIVALAKNQSIPPTKKRRAGPEEKKEFPEADSYSPSKPVNAPEIVTEENWIVGNKDAAEFLGMHLQAFLSARRNLPGKKIPGEQRMGNQPMWTEKILREWHDNRPMNKKRAIKQRLDKQKAAAVSSPPDTDPELEITKEDS